MTSKTFYRDVEFDLEVEYKIKANSDVVNFDHTKIETQKLKISGEVIEKANARFSEAVGFDLTTEQMLRVVFSNVNTIDDLVNGHTDSPARDLFCQVFAKFILNDDRSWPIGYDPQEYTEKFFKDLNETADGLGYVRLPH